MNTENECMALLSKGDNEYHLTTSELEETALLHQDMVPECVQTLNDNDIPINSSSDIHQTFTGDFYMSPDTFDETCVKDLFTGHSQSTETETEIKPPVMDYFEQPVFKLPPDKKYHIFVAHSSEDSPEVKDLCIELEKRFFLKCMNYERDFIPGKLLDDNIYDEMKNSSKILIVISPSFLDSYWCITEARQAFQMAHADGDSLKVIPILLRPVKKEIPSFLKSYRYIDALQEKDVAAKIMDAFYHSAAVDQLYHEKKAFTVEEVKSQNGARLLTIEAVKLTPFCSNGYVYEFDGLTKKENEILKSSLDVNCEEHVAAILNRVNSHPVMRHYRIFSGRKFACGAALLLGMVATAFVFGSYFLSIIVEKIITDYFTNVFFSAFIFGGLIWIGSFGLLFIARRKMVTKLRRDIWKVNSDYFEDNKCLIVFDNTNIRIRRHSVREEASIYLQGR
ncbi:uncharacterized protein LOC127735515 isoform X2 [Mytilus californianus]|uniref:uncharacterized protein LOC127735515 isoform X2 n=1 Tax=Mytilus californianus TaxID=6549 RepID=UPI00224653AB|nr:uncharacterized protein LOC127735515 isoform X2 [Mytilus californianus]